MIKVNSISGGKTSAYVMANYKADYNIFSLVRTSDKDCLYPDAKLRQVVSDKIGKEFIGTLEDDMIIHTVLDLEQYTGQEITWISGETFDDLIARKSNYLPNKISRYCTTDLKTIPIATWMYKNNLNPSIMRFGYRANEQGRAKSMNEKLENGVTHVKIIIGKHKNGNNKWKNIEYCKPEFPLINDAIFKDTIEQYWKDKPVRFAKHNNCVGCWWRNPLFLKKKQQEHPNKFDWFIKQEELTSGKFRSDVSYKEIKSWNPQFELFDDDFNECDSGYCGL